MRTVYLLVYHSPLFPAHWGLWIPNAGSTTIGKTVHVFGDVANGFEHEFKRNYEPDGTNRRNSLIELAQVEDDHVVDSPGEDFSVDTNPLDDVERVALSIPAPSKSLLSYAEASHLSHCLTFLA